MDKNSVIDVADCLWKEINPETKMETPNAMYLKIEKYQKEYFQSDGELTLYDWIKKYKN